MSESEPRLWSQFLKSPQLTFLCRNWIDTESFLLWPTALSLFLIGTCGLIGTNDLLACFSAGCALNWDGKFLAETERRHDEVNSSIDALLNFGGFMYIGTIIPWSDFNDPDGTGITYPRLIGLGCLVLLCRRIPAIFATYKLYPQICRNWEEALFLGYFGPIGIGAVFYVEHTKHLFPPSGEALTAEENILTRAMVPVIYWLVLFSVVVHGLSIPGLNAFLKWRGIKPIQDEEGPIEVTLLSTTQPLPKNSRRSGDFRRRNSIIVNNRFSRGDPDQVPGSGMAMWPQFNYSLNGPDDTLTRSTTKDSQRIIDNRAISFDHLAPLSRTISRDSQKIIENRKITFDQLEDKHMV